MASAHQHRTAMKKMAKAAKIKSKEIEREARHQRKPAEESWRGMA